ncbi:unnamed protein product [Adineta steineri]|uniref:Uncharacterized protein n=1 Tax=Adineta steineri TaxID=433720 RepID=A0A815PSV1_9BILA|nr:unnamed protein product [Adineta steineri]CAF1631239.1 unnamed protein product [Adineta steineri]
MVDGLACYQCNNCNDPFMSTYVGVTYQNDTLPYSCVKTTSAYVTTRNILLNCTSFGTTGNGQWCCQNNLCNKAPKNILTNAFSFSIITSILMIFF